MKKLLLILCLLPLMSQAHAKAKHSLTETAKVAAVGAVRAAATAVVGAAEAAPGVIKSGSEATQKLDLGAIVKSSATTHRHSKVVHFPIALGLVAVLFALLAYKFESFRSSSRWLLFLAALSAIVAILTGRAEEEGIEGMAHQVLEAHELQGYIVCGFLWFNWLLSFFESARKWAWLPLLMMAAAITFTAMLGGALAHMQF